MTELAEAGAVALPTDSEIDALPAGRELDALVAERVMGLPVCEWWHWGNFGSAGGPFITPNGDGEIVAPDGSKIVDTMTRTPEGEQRCPHEGICWPSRIRNGKDDFERFHARYSTDIAAAMEVVEKIKPRGLPPYLMGFRGFCWDSKRQWRVFFGITDPWDPTSGDVGAEADALPIAICRAALKVVCR